MKRISVSLFAVVAFAVAIYSCKDMGHTPPPPLLTANSLSVTLAPGSNTTLTISGGNPPYTISQQPSVSLATASLTGNQLRIQAVSANVSGTTSVKIKDTDPRAANDSPTHEEQEIEIAIRVNGILVLFGTQVQPIFTNNCVSGCHTSGGSAPFSLAAGSSRASMVDVNMNAGCASKRVVANDAAASGLIKKLEGTCGNRMPLGSSTPLPASDIQLIRDWINQGAQNN